MLTSQNSQTLTIITQQSYNNMYIKSTQPMFSYILQSITTFGHYAQIIYFITN
jgi:hypothetical protein